MKCLFAKYANSETISNARTQKQAVLPRSDLGTLQQPGERQRLEPEKSRFLTEFPRFYIDFTTISVFRKGSVRTTTNCEIPCTPITKTYA